MNWQPISEYHRELGPVIVWLEWSAYRKPSGIGKEGQFEHAYLLDVGDRGVWVQAKDCIPIETTGRTVTHFVRLTAPSDGGKQ
jgi:hypothetical protein